MPDIDDFIPSRTKRSTSRCTLPTRGQVASTTCMPRRSASAFTTGDTPWAENTTGIPAWAAASGISANSGRTPRLARPSPRPHACCARSAGAHIPGQPILARPLSGSLRGFENGLYGKNRTVHTRAEASRISEHNAFGHRNLLNVNSVFQCKAGITGICRHNFSASPTNHRFPRNPRASRMMV